MSEDSLSEIFKAETESKVLRNQSLSEDEIVSLLMSEEPRDVNWLYDLADRVRARFMGDAVFLRGIIEFSNYCRKNCFYCGIRRDNRRLKRYRMTVDEIVRTAIEMEPLGITTVVLQSGEDMRFNRDLTGELIRRIKAETDLAVTLSLGERNRETYEYWRDCGTDRYLIRFETSNRDVFRALHPDDDYDKRLNCIRNLKDLGVQTGSGFMIGLPGTTIEDIAHDILLCRELNLDMIGIGPFIPHPDTPLSQVGKRPGLEFCLRVLAVTRLVNPDAHIPATTAFDAHPHKGGRQLALQRGANVFMPNMTPQKYRQSYQLYPGKACVDEGGAQCAYCTQWRIDILGRTIGEGPGHTIKLQKF
ncbi:MAG: [FeFe] hydrogenase H-cluster radical SAM maturase HydE [Calditrichaeota bacterium]|nr:[FeFe] hydrogenase H-cluster radical SAM maturase HydE [Calditrichota bacterium]